ncbi:hypothetical protein VPH1254_0006 [Vibrio phage 1254]
MQTSLKGRRTKISLAVRRIATFLFTLAGLVELRTYLAP